MGDCPRVGRLIGGCKFEGRYSVNEGYTPEVHHMVFTSGPTQKPIPRKTVYVRDVCKTCGKTIERAARQHEETAR